MWGTEANTISQSLGFDLEGEGGYGRNSRAPHVLYEILVTIIILYRQVHCYSKSTVLIKLTAIAIAIFDSVTVSIGLLTSGVFSVSVLVRAEVRSCT